MSDSDLELEWDTGGGSRGLQFFCWSAVEQPEGEAESALQRSPVSAGAESLRVDLTVFTPSGTSWEAVPACGAGDTEAWQIVANIGGAVGLLYGLLKLPGAAHEAWGYIEKLFATMRASRDDWHAGSDVAVVKCLARIQAEVPGAFTQPELVRTIVDGTRAAVWSEMPVGIHVVMIPEFSQGKTWIFVVDSQLNILNETIVDRLTTDAQSFS